MTPRESAPGTIWPRRWKLTLPGPVSGTLAIALGMFVVAAVALTVNLTRQRDSFGWVEHTNEVLRNISAVETRILEAESGERGFLLTGESSYFDSYTRSQADIPKLLEALRQALSDNPSQILRLEELRSSIDARLAEFKQIVELGPTRLNEALAILRTARSRHLTTLIEEKLGQFRQAELALLGERQQRAERDTIAGDGDCSGDGRSGNARCRDGGIPS